MTYGDFTIERLSADFGVEVKDAELFAHVPTLVPSPWLIDSLNIASKAGFGSEKSRSKRLVSPVLSELARRNDNEFAIISGANLDVEPSRGLNGECDFIISFSRLQNFIKAPIFCITEVKKQDIEYGTVQCAAQFFGASRLNEREKKPIKTLYGCSITGMEWRWPSSKSNPDPELNGRPAATRAARFCVRMGNLGSATRLQSCAAPGTEESN